MNIKAPCLNCPDRKVTADYNCHSECKAYLDYSANRKDVYDAKRYSYIPSEYRRESVTKSLRKSGRKISLRDD